MEIYDTTLREGTQKEDVSFNIEQRIRLAQALHAFGVDYIEGGWPSANAPDVMAFFHKAKSYPFHEKLVAFGSTSMSKNPQEDLNLNGLVESGAKTACIFGKSWIEQVTGQLRITPEENLEKISASVRYLKERGVEVFYDAEHFFDGYKHDREYALKTLEAAVECGASRLILCDTNGGTLPDETLKIVKETYEYLREKGIETLLGIHSHHDAGFSLANSIIVLPYIGHIQCTVNGFGERVGNTDLCELAPTLVIKQGMKLGLKLRNLTRLSQLFYLESHLEPQTRQPYVSPNAFSHTGGVHIDAVAKGVSYEHIIPESVGGRTKISLNTQGGAACIVHHASRLVYELDKKDPETAAKMQELRAELRDLEERKYGIGLNEAEIYLLIEKYFGSLKIPFTIEDWHIQTSGKESSCWIRAQVDGQEQIAEAIAEKGPIDVAYNAITALLSSKYSLDRLEILSYNVRIAESKGAESTVRTEVMFSNGLEFSTVGVSDNIIESGIEALWKAFIYYINKNYINKK